MKNLRSLVIPLSLWHCQSQKLSLHLHATSVRQAKGVSFPTFYRLHLYIDFNSAEKVSRNFIHRSLKLSAELFELSLYGCTPDYELICPQLDTAGVVKSTNYINTRKQSADCSKEKQRIKEDEKSIKHVAGIRYEKADVLFYKWIYISVVL